MTAIRNRRRELARRSWLADLESESSKRKQDFPLPGEGRTAAALARVVIETHPRSVSRFEDPVDIGGGDGTGIASDDEVD